MRSKEESVPSRSSSSSSSSSESPRPEKSSMGGGKPGGQEWSGTLNGDLGGREETFSNCGNV